MKVTSIEMNAKDMKDTKEAAEKIMEALGIGGGTADPGDLLIENLIKRTGLGTILELKITIEDGHIATKAGGSKLAFEAVKDSVEGFEELYEETKKRLVAVAQYFKAGMEALEFNTETIVEEK